MLTPAHMRSTLFVAFMALLAAPAFAGVSPDRVLEKTLTPAEVMAHFNADYLPDVRDCWLQHAARQRGVTGRVTISLIITPGGTLYAITVSAEGLKGIRVEDFRQCVETEAEEWTFPDRSGFTAVIIPVQLVKTRAPGSGPFKK